MKDNEVAVQFCNDAKLVFVEVSNGVRVGMVSFVHGVDLGQNGLGWDGVFFGLCGEVQGGGRNEAWVMLLVGVPQVEALEVNNGCGSDSLAQVGLLR